MASNTFLLAFVTLFTIINPFSTASVFLSITPDYTKEERRRIAIKATLFAIITLLAFSLFGRMILDFFSISISAFKITGGLIMANIGWHMLNAKRKRISSEKEREELMEKEDISIVPIAMPMMSGPGAITTAMVLINDTVTIMDRTQVIMAILIVCTITTLILFESVYFDRVLGESGKKALGKIMGLIVVVIGIQFIINGMQGVLADWGFIQPALELLP